MRYVKLRLTHFETVGKWYRPTMRSTWFSPREIDPHRVWSRPRCGGSTTSQAAPRKGMSPTSSPLARYSGQFLRDQIDSHKGGRADP
jgi:hypothetical protein